MSFKFDQVSSKIQQSEAALGQGVGKAAAGEVNYIPPYKATTGTNVGIFNVANRTKTFQQFFKFSGHGPPVFLRSPKDVAIYRGAMAFSVVALGLTFFGIYQMASGTMKKK